jgi:hypothetical protein
MPDFTTAEFWNERYAASDSVWSITPNQFVVEYLSELTPGCMIDLAGGEGRNALWFASRGWQSENADISSVAIEKFLARAEAEGLSERVAGTVITDDQSARFKLAPADLGLIAYLQIPHAALAHSIRDLVAGLCPGATFFGVWHARENLEGGFGGPQREDVLPTELELRAIAADVGLNVVECGLRDRFVDVEGETKRAIDVILHATVS